MFSQLNERFSSMLMTDIADLLAAVAHNGALSRTIAALQANLNNPVHYGDWEVGLWDVDGRSLLIDPKRNYGDLIAFGLGGEDGFAGFLRDCGLPSDTSEALVMGCAGLLLVDQAVEAIDNTDLMGAIPLLYEAQDLADRLGSMRGEEHQKRKRSREKSEHGKKAHEKTEKIKAEMLRVWDEDQAKQVKAFKNRSEWARWVAEATEIDTPETPLRWLRERARAQQSQAKSCVGIAE